MAHIGLEGNRKEEIQLEGDTQHETVLRELTVVMATVLFCLTLLICIYSTSYEEMKVNSYFPVVCMSLRTHECLSLQLAGDDIEHSGAAGEKGWNNTAR